MGRRLNWEEERNAGGFEGTSQNPTLKLRTYQSYEHKHTHTQIQNANTRLYPGLPFFTYLSLFQLLIFVAFFSASRLVKRKSNYILNTGPNM